MGVFPQGSSQNQSRTAPDESLAGRSAFWPLDQLHLAGKRRLGLLYGEPHGRRGRQRRGAKPLPVRYVGRTFVKVGVTCFVVADASEKPGARAGAFFAAERADHAVNLPQNDRADASKRAPCPARIAQARGFTTTRPSGTPVACRAGYDSNRTKFILPSLPTGATSGRRLRGP